MQYIGGEWTCPSCLQREWEEHVEEIFRREWEEHVEEIFR